MQQLLLLLLLELCHLSVHFLKTHSCGLLSFLLNDDAAAAGGWRIRPGRGSVVST